MTINELAVLLLNDFSAEEREIPDHADYPGRNIEVLKAINAAIQEVFGEGSPWIRYDEQGYLAHAPETITLNAANDATAISITAGWQSWMKGCTVAIDGDIGDNKIKNTNSAVAATGNFGNMTLTAVSSGVSGNAISVEVVVTPGTLNIAVEDNAITITGPNTTTWANVISGINGGAASDLVTATAYGTTSNTIAEISPTNLTGGINIVILRTPYGGTSGSKTAVVYNDCIAIPDSVMEVCEPVKCGGRRIFPVVSSGISTNTVREFDYGYERMARTLPEVDSITETAGTPVAYAVETWSPSATDQPATRLFLIPAPAAANTLEIRAKLSPPEVTDLESTDTLPIPQQFVHSIFFPVARKHLSGCPFFIHSTAEQEIQRAYQEALRLLNQLRPSKNQGRRIRSIY